MHYDVKTAHIILKSSHLVNQFFIELYLLLTHCGPVTQICVFNTVKLGTSASSP